jgi:hypothetical protein
MTCYLRMHEVLLGVRRPDREPDWDNAFAQWRQATTVLDRDRALSEMKLQPIDVYELPRADLGRFDGLIVSGRVDQEFLHRQRDAIRGFLDDGKVLVFSGQLFRSWLPGGGACVPDQVGSSGERQLTIAPHPIFEGVRAEDLESSFAQGHHPAPEGAEVLVSLPGGEPVVYIDRATTDGTILAHAGHTLLGYASSNTTARRIVPQLLAWIGREVR